MGKKRISIVLFIFLLCLTAGGILYLHPKQQTHQISTVEKAQIVKKTAQMSQDPAVVQIRFVLNSYLEGKITGTSNPQLVINGDPTLNRKGVLLTGLKNFSPEYYKSKFVALRKSVNQNGEVIDLEFIDKPDKIFVAEVDRSTKGSFNLIYFGQNLQVTSDRIQRLNSQYAFLLQDRAHAL
jgi:hypothetical protein